MTEKLEQMGVYNVLVATSSGDRYRWNLTLGLMPCQENIYPSQENLSPELQSEIDLSARALTNKALWRKSGGLRDPHRNGDLSELIADRSFDQNGNQ